jgi:hypothetical protein
VVKNLNSAVKLPGFEFQLCFTNSVTLIYWLNLSEPLFPPIDVQGTYLTEGKGKA